MERLQISRHKVASVSLMERGARVERAGASGKKARERSARARGWKTKSGEQTCATDSEGRLRYPFTPTIDRYQLAGYVIIERVVYLTTIIRRHGFNIGWKYGGWRGDCFGLAHSWRRIRKLKIAVNYLDNKIISFQKFKVYTPCFARPARKNLLVTQKLRF